MKFVIVFLAVISIAILWIYLNPADSTTMIRIKNLGEPDSTNNKGTKMENKIVKTDEEWKKELSPEEYRILREKGTERAFTGKYWDHHELGIYICAACGTELFESNT